MSESFSAYPWQYRYCSSALNRSGKPTNVLHDFYLPALQRAAAYDRVAGYFRSTSLAAASQGYTAFLQHGGQMRLVVGADLQIQDVSAILAGQHQRLSERLLDELCAPESWPEEVRSGVALLGTMVASGQLEVRVAFRVSSLTGKPISADSCDDGYVHEKWFIMTDKDGSRLYGSGSLNESRTALVRNAENIDIHCDWKNPEDAERADGAQRDFEQLWNNENAHMRVFSVPEAVKERLIHLKDLQNQPTEIDGTVFPLRKSPTPKELLQFAVLRDAPHMPGGEFIGMYSAPVSPWPHQEIVSRRLIESWPYSYLMCDEVGLGKTIEAALAIRSLYLSGKVKRVLVVAPASLTEQWHRELAQKAMLSFALSRVKPGGAGKIIHSYLYPSELQQTDENLYGPNLNIVSSGLVRRKERLQQLLRAEPFDIVLVDEAHYARRQNPRDGDTGNPRYGDLYIAMQDGLRKKTKCLWMATATPMQIDPIEVYDLIRLTNRAGQFQSDPSLCTAYFRGLGTLVNRHPIDSQTREMMGQSFRQIEKLDPYLWANLQETAITGKNRRVLENLPFREPHRADIRQLIQPMFAASPLQRVMMRHTRALLEIYRRNGELQSNLARRIVRPVCAIAFTDAEAQFYDMLESYCNGLSEQIRKYNSESRQVMVFLLNFLQLRFASSFYAIQKTLERRLKRVENTLMFHGTPNSEADFQERLDELKDNDDYSEGDLDDMTMDALLRDRSAHDLEWEKMRLKEMLEQLGNIHETPSKIQALLKELSGRRISSTRLRQTVLFTRFYDTLTSIRQFLCTREPTMRIGIYAGGNKAFWYDPEREADCGTSHEEIKAKFLSGEIDLLLCTDAAAEGLNLQTADLLINFDLGWNPMKIEQRIGRIDRIGQKHAEIAVLNMCYVGSAEQIVYGRLLERLQQANLIVGAQQISLLPVTQEEFQKLHTGEITPEQLEAESILRIRKQKEANASMEINAEDLYQMYNRASSKMKAQPYSATEQDLWDCLVNSPYLSGLGAGLQPDGTWLLPSTETCAGLKITNCRDNCSADRSYASWGNPDIERLFTALSDAVENRPYMRRITIPGDDAVIAYAVSVTGGTELVISYSQIKALDIDEQREVSNADAADCCRRLENLIKGRSKSKLMEKAEQHNVEIAELHRQFISNITIEILKQLLSAGCVKIADAMKQIEANRKAVYQVELPASIFGGKASQLLFLTSESAGMIHVPVYGILLSCALDLAKRESNAIRGKKSEKNSVDVIHRLERR